MTYDESTIIRHLLQTARADATSRALQRCSRIILETSSGKWYADTDVLRCAGGGINSNGVAIDSTISVIGNVLNTTLVAAR